MGLFGSILACMILWQVAACTVMEPRRELVIWRGCDGKDHAADVTIHVGLPALECIALAARNGEGWAVAELILGFPALACVNVGPEDENRIRKAEIWHAPLAFDFTVQHELDHIKGRQHPRFLPFVHTENCNG